MAFSQPPVVSPPVPYVGPCRLFDQQHVVIQGKVPFHSQGFSINFTMSPDTALKDTALHFNPRFNESCVVRNALQYGSWGSEERSGGLPFQKGVPFEIIFAVHHGHYKISINGRHFVDFKHRLPTNKVIYLVIKEDVEINFIKFEGAVTPSFQPFQPFQPPGAQPFQPPGAQPFQPPGTQPFQPPGYGVLPPPYMAGAAGGGYPQSYPAGGASQPMFNPAVPLTVGIPGTLYNGRMIFISGVPHPNPSRMTINLQCGTDIALHFDIRFNFGDSRNVVVRTHCQNGTYGSEERHQSYFPFMPNANFDMIILVEPSCFKIAVNNQHFTEFNHRLPVNSVTALNVQGDLRLTQVRFQ